MKNIVLLKRELTLSLRYLMWLLVYFGCNFIFLLTSVFFIINTFFENIDYNGRIATLWVIYIISLFLGIGVASMYYNLDKMKKYSDFHIVGRMLAYVFFVAISFWFGINRFFSPTEMSIESFMVFPR